jgi:L-amino acid N-acyltransferase YncA
MPSLTIRPATPADAEAIAAIYNHYVTHSVATFDTQATTAENRRAWLGEHGEDHPVLVAEAQDGDVVAWGSLSRWGTRCAYRHSVEMSVYVREGYTGQRLGPRISRSLLELARERGHHAIVSQVVADNEASLKMAAQLGFERVGCLREVGRKFGRWLDVVIMELLLDVVHHPAEECACES